MEIDYYRKNVYGNELMYVASEDAKYAIYALTGKNSISPLHINALESLGCTFKEVLAPRV